MREYVIKDRWVIEREKEVPLVMRVDVAVVGGGVAGIGAALAAARNGVRVVLIEHNNCLGGTATAGLVCEFGGQGGYEALSGLPREIIDRLIKIGGAVGGRFRSSFDLEMFKTVAFQMVEESAVKLLLYSMVVGAIVTDNEINGVIVENKSGRQAILADVVIDATGDADVAVASGVPYVKGREKDGKMRPMTLMFRMGNVNINRLLEFVKKNPDQFSPDPSKNIMDLDLTPKVFRPFGFFGLVEEARNRGELPPDCYHLRLDNVSFEQGTLFVNTTRVYNVDGTKAEDLTRAEIEARKQIQQIVTFLKKYVPGFEASFLIDSASNIGVRETKRIIGKYVLTEEDIVQGKEFEDVIARPSARSAPGVSIHSPDGKEGAVEDVHYRKFIDSLYTYNIPYRCLLPKNIDRLLVAGRCISATHQADGWTRVIPSCLATGEAAGTAAAICVQRGVKPSMLDISLLQKTLLTQGVNLGDRVANLLTK